MLDRLADVPAKSPVAAVVNRVEADVQERQAREAAIDAYVYAYPLVMMELTRRVVTSVAASDGSKAPMGQVARMRAYPAAEDHSVVAPNANTLYLCPRRSW